MRSRGFTLVEMTIAVAILALAIGITIPAVSNLSLADLRANASKLAGLVRQTYDAAALTGQTYRLVFDFESGRVAVQATEQVLNFDPETHAPVQAKPDEQPIVAFDQLALAPDEDGVGAAKGDEADTSSPGVMAAMFGVNQAGAQGGLAGDEAFASGGPGLALNDDVHLLDVWIQGMSEPVRQGKGYLYFFPNGYAQDALIHLEDEEKRVFTVKVRALTGTAAVENGYVEMKR